MNPLTCPEEFELETFLAGECPEARGREITRHLERCTTCGAWLERARDEEDLLLDLRGAVGDGATPAVVPDLAPDPAPDLARYRIVRRIGAGGMGIVYEAEQKHPRRTVALKVLQSGRATEATLRRFEHEAELLGRLDHPGIARVFEAGTFGGASDDTSDRGGLQPFFAMELVRGRPLTEHARRLDRRATLELFARVCDAVQHAHQKGVVHRDLKPSNVLVLEDGQPKVLDFGVARAVDDAHSRGRTLPGQLLGTLAYMSPEQAGAGSTVVDTRSDVYALGAILYELLTGRRPLELTDRPMAEALRAIERDDPVPLGRVDRALRGDLEAIAQRALAKEPARRYASAAALAADVRRYLDHEPIDARPPTAGYQLGRFARRNRGLVLAAAAVFVVLAVGLVATRSQAVRAARAEAEARAERDSARREAQRARTTLAFLVDLLEQGNPDAGGRGVDYTVREALDEAARHLEQGAALEPEVEADLCNTLGEAYLSLELLERAEGQLERALDLRRELHGNASTEVADALVALGALRYRQWRYREAEALATGALALYRRLFDEDDARVARALHNLACALYYQGREAEAEPLFLEALELREALLDGNHADVASSLQMIGDLRETEGRIPESGDARRRALEVLCAAFGEDHVATARCRRELGRFLFAHGQHAEAEVHLRRALASLEHAVGASHPDFAATAAHLAIVVQHHDPGEALELYARALPELRRSLAPDDDFLVNLRRNMGVLMTRDGDFDAGVEHQLDWLADFRAHPDADAAVRAEVERGLAVCLQHAGRLDEAEAVFRETLADAELRRGEDDLAAASVRTDLAYLLFSRGESAAAEPLFRRSLATWDATGSAMGRAFTAHAGLAQLLARTGRVDEAEEHFRLALERAGDDAPRSTVGQLEAVYGAFLLDVGRFAEAEARLTVADRELASSLGADHPSVREVRRTLQTLDDVDRHR